MDTLDRVGIAAACAAVVVLELVAIAGWQGWTFPLRSAHRPAEAAIQKTITLIPDVAKAPFAQAGPPPVAPRADDAYYAQLRRKMRWVSTRMGESDLLTPDLNSRMLLVKAAADRARLWEVGLGPRDVYGIINAETSWVPRRGASKDGTPNLGIAQFEPATARALGLTNPHDAVESVHVAALHMREAAVWSAERIGNLKLSALERGVKLREGVSIYYNLSSRGRSTWNGVNTGRLPRETQLHIMNARVGARQADFFNSQPHAALYAPSDRTEPTLVAVTYFP